MLFDGSGSWWTEYHYDLENSSLYASANNRMEFLDTFDTTGGGHVALSRTWYYYHRKEGQSRISRTRTTLSTRTMRAGIAR